VAAALGEFDRAVVDGAVNGAAWLWGAGAGIGGVFDKRILDGVVNGIGIVVRSAGAQLRRIQVGRVQVYQGVMLVSLVLLMLLIVVKGA
jgi:NADH:ubiquinone oxidoreductase subunit 5 (subunit L)/multisubunit Na+/H+ antiporter MnhA subunit